MKQRQDDASQQQSYQQRIDESGYFSLPNREDRETVVPDFDDEIDFRELIDTVIRRRNIVLAVLLVCFTGVALNTFMATPQFKATGVLQVSSQSEKLTNFADLKDSTIQNMEFQQTQVNLLQSEQLALRVIKRMDLANNPLFNPEASANSGKPQTKGFLQTIKDFIRPPKDKTKSDIRAEEAKKQTSIDSLLAKFRNLFIATPVRNSELIDISFTSPSPAFAAEVANTTMKEFINMHMDSKVHSSENAAKFLEHQIEAAQIKLEKSEMALQSFARKIGIVSLDSKTNLILRQLEELNDALAKAKATRVSLEGKYQQVVTGHSVNLSQMVGNPLIQNLKQEYASLLAQYQQLGQTFKPAYPQMQQLKSKMDQINAQIHTEENAIIDSIRNDYETALKSEKYLAKRTEEQKQLAMGMQEKATQYKILDREVETNKSIYQSLLERAKEIEATVGAAVTNIQIVDVSRPPLHPDTPKVRRNLLLGLVLGLVGGVGAAFLLEYFDDTIKSANEMEERFGIPVLGLIPFDKKAAESGTSIATKFYTDPRSPVAEAFRTTMTAVRLAVADDPPKTILFTSILPEAGKSTLSSNACLSYLADDETCLLIDADLRKPSQHNTFSNGVKGQGLSSVLTGMASLSDVIVKTEYPGLDFISCGPLPPSPAELISSKRMRQLLATLAQQYDRVIVDSPPYQGFAEILVLSHMVDGVILVTVEGVTPREGVKQFRRTITDVGGRILGTIINKSGRRKGYGAYGGYKYYSYQYNYSYGKDQEHKS